MLLPINTIPKAEALLKYTPVPESVTIEKP